MQNSHLDTGIHIVCTNLLVVGIEWVACKGHAHVYVCTRSACRVFLRCRHASKQRFMKRRTDVSQKLQLLDNKRGAFIEAK